MSQNKRLNVVVKGWIPDPGEFTTEIYRDRKGQYKPINLKLKTGDVLYTVWLDGGDYYDTPSQSEAIILSELIKIRILLNSLSGQMIKKSK